jgi:hypothetical protein
MQPRSNAVSNPVYFSMSSIAAAPTGREPEPGTVIPSPAKEEAPAAARYPGVSSESWRRSRSWQVED